MSVPDFLAPPVYRLTMAVFNAAVRLYFRRIEVRNPERFPVNGPLLITANHPAGLTDVYVLGTHLPRRIHFLAKSSLFKPWIRRLGMQLVGALPVYRREDDPRQMHRNEETFRACHEFLDGGGAVLIFPEGISETDRRLKRMKTGAARLALAQEARPGQQGRLTLLPVGLHMSDRSRFQSDVILSLGRPIDLASYHELAASDSNEAVVWLTTSIQAAMEELFLLIPEPAVTDLVHDIENLYVEELKSAGDTRHELELARRVSDCVEYYRETDPERMYRVWRQISGYRRKLEALKLEDEALRELDRDAHWKRAAVRGAVISALGLLPALVGGLIHVLPCGACEWIARRSGPRPSRVSSVRIAAGIFILPLMYAALALLFNANTEWPPHQIALTLTLSFALGVFALQYFRWLRLQRARIRLTLLAVRRRRMVERMRTERRELVRIFDEARREFLAATEPQSPTSNAI